MATGIEERHTRQCRTRKGGRCDCEPSFRAAVWDGERQQRVRQTFGSHAEAVGWRRDARVALRRGRRVQVRSGVTLREAAAEWQRLALSNVIRTNKGDVYKPAAIRAYSQHLRMRVFDRMGDEPLVDLTRPDWQALVDDLLAEGFAPATVGATVAAVGAIYRHEVSRGRLKDNPLRGLDLPTPDNNGERFASPGEAAALLAAAPDNDRAVWATAMYAGLRCGELRALEARAVRLDDGVIDVHYGWDWKEGRIATKGRNRRKVPIASALRELLVAELLATGRRESELIFGSTPSSPFSSQSLQRRADAAWKAAGLNRITLHACRHSYASLMIAAGVNAKAISSYLGHSSIAVTFDVYGHLLSGNEEEAAGLLDALLTRPAAI